jgi:hypothetical protein
MVEEAQALVKTYLEGAGIVAWHEHNGHYAAIPLKERISTVDDVLYRIASEITKIAPAGQEPPAAQLPTERAIEPKNLAPDTPKA